MLIFQGSSWTLLLRQCLRRFDGSFVASGISGLESNRHVRVGSQLRAALLSDSDMEHVKSKTKTSLPCNKISMHLISNPKAFPT